MRWRSLGLDSDSSCCRCYIQVPSGEEPLSRRPRTVGLPAALALAGVAAGFAAVATAAVLQPRGAPPSSVDSGGVAAEAPAAAALVAGLSPEVEALTPPPDAHSIERARKAERLFGELTAEEIQAVAAFTASALGCSTAYQGPGAAGLRGCFLSGSEAVVLKVPGKTSALAHLDGAAPAPPRMAQVIVVHGEKPVEEGVGVYSVGPLDGQGGVAKYASVNLIESLHFNRRPVDMGDSSVNGVITQVVLSLRGLLQASFGDSVASLLAPTSGAAPESGQFFVLTSPAVGSTLERRVSRVVFNWFRSPEYFQICWMHPLPFSFDIVHVGAPDRWFAENITYCGQMFSSVESLLSADKHGELVRCTSIPDSAYTWDSDGPDPGTPEASKTTVLGPAVAQTWHVLGRGGIRWRDWELQATVRPASGLALYDVRWRGERILYELALSDAHAYYSSGRAEKQFHYSDKAFSLSGLSGDMLLGLDCPEGATLLDGALWLLPKGSGISGDPSHAKAVKLACVFETSGFQGSLWRHAQLLSRKVAGRPLRQLVVRSVSTVGNYDYITEVHFGEDGSVRVRNDFAGYPETDHAAPFRDPPAAGRRIVDATSTESHQGLDWGNRVRGDLVAMLHSHFAVWKVDLDILGTKNDFHVLKTEVAEGLSDGFAKKVQRDVQVEREDPDTPLVARATSPGLWRVVNSEAPNPINGAPRGYSVMIETAPAVQTLPPSHPFSITGSFAKRHLAVARRKEEEPSATHSLDHYPLTSPLLSVDRFLEDREAIVGEDLVCWVSVGKEHITRAEDIPLVSNFGVQFALLPWNYHVENPAMQLPMVTS